MMDRVKAMAAYREMRSMDEQERRAYRALWGAETYRLAMWLTLAIFTVRKTLLEPMTFWGYFTLVVVLLGVGIAHWGVNFWNLQLTKIEQLREEIIREYTGR